MFQYERRVPRSIQRNPERYARFGNRPLYRRSLGTKDLGQMGQAYALVHREFEALIREGQSDRPACASSLDPVPESQPPSRMVTNIDLEEIANRYRDLIAAPYERLNRKANVDRASARELERMEYALELDAEDIQRCLAIRFSTEKNPRLDTVDDARFVVRNEGFNAPEGSEEFGAIIAAIRKGYKQGYERVTQLASGELLPSLPDRSKPSKPKGSISLREATQRYIDARDLSAKAISETQLALRQFEEIIGNKSIIALTREDCTSFANKLSHKKVGTKSQESVERYLSIHTINKRLRMLSAVFRYAVDQGWIEGNNPMSGVQVSALGRPSNKVVMPEKRRFQDTELELILQHPWFTGCKSSKEIYTPGHHRLNGSQYWVPIVALLTGCRAGELGGMKLEDIKINHKYPHY
ncbi:phage integrase N-terminal SAM-like domain-containing protein [Sphingomonas sp. MM-1]|uniref:phage integrase N-terminal SAM-like domain-containing protein n=1 Tax=Sphingomonas sp. MM-1 TaxID=745310 RepID=UPI001182CAC6|nr:phage integrase N-terminal SAM-like domain-containing protein [Sphingomonas sp. MM-1]